MKITESLYLQNSVNCDYTISQIEYLYGPFEQEEIDFYYKELDGKINNFQKGLVFNLFYKYFGDPVSIKSINMDQYIKLVIASKRLLEGYSLRILPYILSGKVIKLVRKKSINKKEFMDLCKSVYYNYVVEKYIGQFNSTSNSLYDIVDGNINNIIDEKIEQELKSKYIIQLTDDFTDEINSLIATLSASTFKFISYDDRELNGTIIDNIPMILKEEVLMYLLLI